MTGYFMLLNNFTVIPKYFKRMRSFGANVQ